MGVNLSSNACPTDVLPHPQPLPLVRLPCTHKYMPQGFQRFQTHKYLNFGQLETLFIPLIFRARATKPCFRFDFKTCVYTVALVRGGAVLALDKTGVG